MRIKMYSLIVIMLSMSITGCKKQSDTVTGNQLKWHTFNEGIETAKKEKKIVIVDFYAAWCRWCKVMEDEIFSDAEMISRINKNFICIRLYMDRPSGGIINYRGNQLSNQQFSMMMSVTGLPTLLFLNHKEEVITIVPGYTQKHIFSTILDYTLDYTSKNCIEKKVNFNDFVSGKGNCSG